MPEWVIQKLTKAHDRSAFDCGNEQLNDWLKLRAGQFERRDLARTYVAVQPEQDLVLGYYAICNHCVNYESLPLDEAKGLPRMDVPVVLLGRLAVDRSVQGQGLGAMLLIDAVRRSIQIAEEIGIRAVEVDAVDEMARRFYIKYGFVTLLDDRNHLFLPMHVVQKLGFTAK